MFHVGQKVVCVDDEWIGFSTRGGPTIHPKCLPVKGEVYEISGICPPDDWAPWQVYLAEFPAIEPDWDSPLSFAPQRFRPLTDTSIATVLARKAPKDSRKWDNRHKVRTPA